MRVLPFCLNLAFGAVIGAIASKFFGEFPVRLTAIFACWVCYVVIIFKQRAEQLRIKADLIKQIDAQEALNQRLKG